MSAPKADITRYGVSCPLCANRGTRLMKNGAADRAQVLTEGALWVRSARFKNEATKRNTDPRTASANTADDRNELRSVDRPAQYAA